MTVYVGEIARIAVAASYDRSPTLSSPLVPADVTDATISVWLKTGTVYTVEDEPLTWDDNHEVWRYNWDTTGCEAGSYRVKATFLGPGGLDSWEFQDISLKADKTIVIE